MRIRVGIDGMGRIGRAVLRGVIERDDTAVEVVAVNDLTPVATLAHLLRYDSTYGRWPVEIEVDSEHLSVDGRLVRVFGEPDPAALDWRARRGLECVLHHELRSPDGAGAGAGRVAGGPDRRARRDTRPFRPHGPFAGTTQHTKEVI